jgi:ABC-type nitrate/sulfonate/bicarbonate transport system substrate-binding protein
VASFSPLYIAYEENTFGRYGLTVTLRQIATAAVTPAIVNHEVDLFASSAAPIITADLNGNLDEVYIGSVLNRQTDTFLAAPDIKTPEQLKGKMVGTDKPGTPGDFNTRQMLSKMGLKPTDVVLRVLGGSDVTVPAILSGQIQALSAGLPFNFTLADKGYNILTNAYDLPNLSNGYVVLKSRESELGPALPAFLAGIRDAVNIYNTQPDVAQKVLAKYTKESDPKVAEETYNFYKTMVHFDPNLTLEPDTLVPMLGFLGGTIPAAKDAKPEQFFDTQYIAKMPPAKS